MKTLLTLGITVLTLLLVVIAWFQSGGLTRHEISTGATAEEAVQALMADIQARDWDRAYSRLDRSNDVQETAFVRDIAGSDGSLRTYGSLQGFDIYPLRADEAQAVMRVRMKWSTAVGPIDDTRDLQVRRDGSVWRVQWP